MLTLLKFTQALITLMLLHQCSGSANYFSLPNEYNAPAHGLTFAAPLPCDSPPPLPSYAETFYNHPPLQFGTSFPISFASAPHFKHAAAAPAPTFVKYSHEPRIKVTHGAPVTTTYTTALGFAAPAVQGNATPLGTFQPFAPAQATFGAPTSSYAAGGVYAASSNVFTPSSYAAGNFVSPFTPVKRFRAPLPINIYSYAQGLPNGVW